MESSSNAVDRISSMPDSVIHFIFSFLDTKSMIQASFLSKRWRYIWMDTPYLKFDLAHFLTTGDKNLDLHRFMNFVDRVLLFRGSSTVYKFDLYSKEHLETDHLSTWLMTVVKRGAQELCLDSLSDKDVQLPHNIFTSYVTVMKIRGVSSNFILPNTVCLNNKLTSLELVNLNFPDGNFNHELKFNFMVLKNLVLHDCTYSDHSALALFAPQLERLEVTHLFLKNRGPQKISICSPKLRCFLYMGYMYDCGYQFFKNLPELDNAVINLRETYVQPKQLYRKCVKNLFTEIHRVKKLTIPDSLLKTVVGAPYLLEVVTNLLHNLRILKLVDWTCSSIQTINSFLERLPQIETFIWSRILKGFDLGTPDEEDGGSTLSLRTIYIIHCNGDKQELKLLEILLKKSSSLKEVIIRKSKSPSLDIKEFAKFEENLSKLPRASSNVLISYRS